MILQTLNCRITVKLTVIILFLKTVLEIQQQPAKLHRFFIADSKTVNSVTFSIISCNKVFN